MARLNIANSRRQQIIDATIRVMAARGWKDTSIDEITREAGVSRGLLAYHFKDKSQLLAGVLARCHELFAAAVAETIASSDDPTEQLRNASRNAVLMARDAPASYEVFLHFSAGARSDPELGAQVRDLYRGFRRAIAAGIRRGQASGHFRPLNPRPLLPATWAQSSVSPSSGCSIPALSTSMPPRTTRPMPLLPWSRANPC